MRAHQWTGIKVRRYDFQAVQTAHDAGHFLATFGCEWPLLVGIMPVFTQLGNRMAHEVNFHRHSPYAGSTPEYRKIPLACQMAKNLGKGLVAKEFFSYNFKPDLRHFLAKSYSTLKSFAVGPGQSMRIKRNKWAAAAILTSALLCSCSKNNTSQKTLETAPPPAQTEA